MDGKAFRRQRRSPIMRAFAPTRVAAAVQSGVYERLLEVGIRLVAHGFREPTEEDVELSKEELVATGGGR